MKIKVESVSKSFRGINALNSVCFEAGSGIYGLAGRNGAGKSVLLRILAAEQKPSSGRVTLDGRDIQNIPDYVARVGYLPQRSKAMPLVSLYSYLDIVCVRKKISAGGRKSEIFRVLNLLGLEYLYKTRLSELSDGTLRRAEIAAALIGDPRILIFDCPTTGLDPEERLSFYNLMYQMARTRTIILSTQLLGDAERFCKNIAILDKGRLIYAGATDELVLSLLDKTWECPAEPETEPQFMRKNFVTSAGYNRDRFSVRYIGLRAESDNSERTVPTLHDAYIHILGGLKTGRKIS